ncbi:MAG: WYL domain-containing protein [Acidimicrobiales bacterium]|jgi:predicted DNA-binding transcriptional regulator YafY|nr:WYL domain-containing protein [Acidimicrobiales bacterium]
MPREAVEARLQRMLALIVEYEGRGWVPVAEVLDRFHCTRATLARDLALLCTCGVPSYELPDELIDAVFDDEQDTLLVDVPDVFRRVGRLSGGEGLAVLTAAATLLELQPDEVLASAVDKLRERLQLGADLAVELERPPALEVFLDAHRARRVVEGRYWTAYRDAVEDRRLEPHFVFYGAGTWYARCLDRRDQTVKLFRLDRFEWARATAQTFELEHADDSTAMFTRGATAVTAMVWFPESADWVRRSLEVREVATRSPEPHGEPGFTAELQVVGTSWLANLLLRTGGRVLDPPALRGIGPDAARRALARYGASG